MGTRKIRIELTIDDTNADDVMSAIDNLLDDGGIQNMIAEYVDDVYGGEIEFLESSATFADSEAT
jgi:hypothetical protein